MEHFGERAEIIYAANSAEGLKILRDRRVALLIVDPGMKNTDSIKFLSRARDISPDTLRVLLNCAGNPSLIIQAINQGKVWKCLNYPFKKEEVQAKIQEGLIFWRQRRESEARPVIERPDFYLQLVKKISDLLNQSEELNFILHEAVNIISRALNYDVVSVYLWNEADKKLVLRATVGLNLDSHKPVTLKPNQGLTGQVFHTRRPLIAMPASKNPFYKYFPALGEEPYESYIGVPILLGIRVLGVLVAQTKAQRHFASAEKTLLQIITSRLAGLLDLANRMEKLGKKTPKKKHASQVYQGKGVSSGYAVGKAYILRGLFTEMTMDHLESSGRDNEILRLKRGFKEVEKDQKELIQTLAEKSSLTKNELNIFKAHLMIVQDATSMNTIAGILRKKNLTAEQAVVEGFESFAGQFAKHKDRYFREREQDFRDIGEKILQKLLSSRGKWTQTKRSLEGAVVVAKDITPSLLPTLNSEKVAAIVTETGGETSHAAILARSLEIPAVSGIENISNIARRGEKLLVDGKTGLVFKNPDKKLLLEYEKNQKQKTKIHKTFEKDALKAAKPEVEILLSANIGFPADVDFALKYNMINVGLFRTEFTFMQYEKWPTVLEQFRIYNRIAQKFKGYLTVRTLDVGADKLLPYFKFPKEDNPMLGLRSIRFSMEYLDFFKDQIKAILLGAQQGGRFRILLPMVSHMWEIETATEILQQTGEEMSMDVLQLPELGITAEVPGVLNQFEDFREHIRFITVGTNDLIQYLLAVDRNSTLVSHLYSCFHPSVIRTLYEISQKGQELNLEVSACGEMAGTPAGALALIALDYKNISILPIRMPAISFMNKKLNSNLLKDIKSTILHEKRQIDIESYLNEALESIDPKLSEME